MTSQEMLNRAIEHHRAGRIGDAESLYRQILAEQPRHPDALNLLGLVAHSCHNYEAAEGLISQAVAVQPHSPDYHFNLGLSLMAQGKFGEAIRAFSQATTLKPDWPEAFNNLGTAFQEQGQLNSAVECFNCALELRPNNAEFHYNLGNVLIRLKHLDKAVLKFKEAIALRPNYAEAYSNLSNALCGLGQLKPALTAVQEALRIWPDYPEALNNLGSILLSLDRLEEAKAAFERAVVLRPNYVDAHNNLGNTLYGLCRFSEAVAAQAHALALEPNRVDILCNLSNAYRGSKNISAALEMGKRAVAICPDDSSGWQSIAAAHYDMNEMDEALVALQETLVLQPDSYCVQNNIANVFRRAGRLTEAIELYDRAAKVDPRDHVAASNRLFCLQFHPDFDAGQLLAEHRRWDEKYARALRGSIVPHTNDRSLNRRLRIGYMSPDFRGHCQSLFTEPLLSHHDHEQFEIFCYSLVAYPDGVTQRFKKYPDVWRPITGRSDEIVADMIRNDRIDILVDLTMQMAFCRPLVMARKPAPVQIAWLAYPGTTGVSAIDYRLTDPYLDPESHDDRYVERSIRLPETFWCYDPLGMEPDRSPDIEPLPEVGELPALRNGYITFGCLNDFTKINDGTLKRWAGVMREVDGSRLRLLAPNGQSRERTLKRMSEFGVRAERIEFVDRQPRRAYLAEFGGIDMCLDTLPYNGHTTNLDSLWMGVPVITQVGKTVVGRAGWSQLSNLGLTELAAHGDQEFIEIACAWSGDLPRLAELRRGLRERMAKSPLMGGERFTRNMEAVFRQVWQTWCGSRTS